MSRAIIGGEIDRLLKETGVRVGKVDFNAF